MSSLGIISTFFFLAMANPPLQAPRNMEKPVLIGRQSGTDITWFAPESVDYPNGAWGLEIVIPKSEAISYSPVDAMTDSTWLDLASMTESESKMYLAYRFGLDLYSNDADAAVEQWSESARIAKELGNGEIEMHAHFLKTVALVRLGRHDESIRELQYLTERFTDSPFALYVRHALGSSIYRKGEDMVLAREILGEVISAATETADDYNWVVASRQYCYTYLKHNEKVAAECLEALVLSPKLKKFPIIEATVLNTFALSLDKLGESLRAKDILKELLKLRRELGSELGIAMTQMAMAHIDRKIGQSLKSLSNYLQSYRTLKRRGIKTHELTSVIALGELYLELGDTTTAASWFELASLADTDLHQEQAYATLGLAEVQLSSQDLAGAKESLSRIRTGESTNLALKTEIVLMQLRVLVAEGSPLPPQLIEKAVQHSEELGNMSFIGRARYFRALSLASNGYWEEAAGDIQASRLPENEISTRLSATILDADRLFQEGDIQRSLDVLNIAIELESGRLEQAPSWHVHNSSQKEIWSRALAWTLEQGGQSSHRSLWELDKRRRSLGRYASERQLSFADRNTSAMNVLSSAARQAMADEVINTDQLEQLAQLDIESPSVTQISPHSTISVPTVSYWLDQNMGVAIVHNGQTPTVRMLPPQYDRRLRSLISNDPSGLNDPGSLRAASQVLLAPIEDLLPESGPLNIAIDGYLAAIPFELLPINNWTMLDIYDIAYVHYPLTHGTERIELKSAAAIVNPQYNGELEALNQSIGEAELVQHYFAQSTISAGQKANRETLGTLSNTPLNVLHLGVHARASVEWSAWSGLWMGGPEFVSAREVAASHYPVDLVFLSACSTSVGSFELTGTTQTLSLAWLMAGSKSVISTLWDVSDAGAYEFSAALYENLKTQSLRSAVANAKRTMVQSGIWSDPQFWAPFQLWVG